MREFQTIYGLYSITGGFYASGINIVRAEYAPEKDDKTSIELYLQDREGRQNGSMGKEVQISEVSGDRSTVLLNMGSKGGEGGSEFADSNYIVVKIAINRKCCGERTTVEIIECEH